MGLRLLNVGRIYKLYPGLLGIQSLSNRMSCFMSSITASPLNVCHQMVIQLKQFFLDSQHERGEAYALATQYAQHCCSCASCSYLGGRASLGRCRPGRLSVPRIDTVRSEIRLHWAQGILGGLCGIVNSVPWRDSVKTDAAHMGGFLEQPSQCSRSMGWTACGQSVNSRPFLRSLQVRHNEQTSTSHESVSKFES